MRRWLEEKKRECWISSRAGREIVWDTLCGKHKVMVEGLEKLVNGKRNKRWTKDQMIDDIRMLYQEMKRLGQIRKA